MPSPNDPAQSATASAPAPAPFSTPALLAAMLRKSAKISDLFFSPGKPPMVEINGSLAPTGPRALTADDTRHIASELIGSNKHALDNLREQGSCDVSYSLPGGIAISRECIYAARQLRHRDAGHTKQSARIC